MKYNVIQTEACHINVPSDTEAAVPWYPSERTLEQCGTPQWGPGWIDHGAPGYPQTAGGAAEQERPGSGNVREATPAGTAAAERRGGIYANTRLLCGSALRSLTVFSSSSKLVEFFTSIFKKNFKALLNLTTERSQY